MDFSFDYDWQHDNGRPNYRYFKLAFTVALRLGIAVTLKERLQLVASGQPTNDPAYKSRRNYLGNLTINGTRHADIVFVVDEGKTPADLVTFWRKGQQADRAGTKGGAHPFAELYMGYLLGKTVERKVFDTVPVAALSEEYNDGFGLNIQAWIVNNLPADTSEPPQAPEPIERPSSAADVVEALPELKLINKWRTDVRRSGVPYTNYEVDACVRRVKWNPADERISMEIHWENDTYVEVKDFGKFDQYASTEERKRVLRYLQNYDGQHSRPRLILTVKGSSTEWLLASATMLRRLGNLI